MKKWLIVLSIASPIHTDAAEQVTPVANPATLSCSDAYAGCADRCTENHPKNMNKRRKCYHSCKGQLNVCVNNSTPLILDPPSVVIETPPPPVIVEPWGWGYGWHHHFPHYHHFHHWH